MAGVYWIGQDGKTYVRADGVNNGEVFSGDSSNQSFVDLVNGLTRIDDPVNPPKQETPVDNSVADAAAQKTALTQAAIENTNKAVSSLDTEAATGSKNIDDSYDSLMGKYANDTAKNEGDFTEQTVTNNQNLLKNKQNALLSAAQGRRGLRGTLASLGALSGTGGDLADRAVTKAANTDLGEATDTFGTNAQVLDKAIKNYREEDKNRRAEAETSRTNQKTALEGNIATKRQSFFQKLAELFGGAGNTNEATRYLNEAGNLNDTIAAKSAVVSTPFSERSAAFTPGSLESYLAGAGDMTVGVKSGGAGGMTPSASIFAGRKKKEDKPTY